MAHDKTEGCSVTKQDLEKKLTALILEGLESGEPIPADAAYWDNLRKELNAEDEEKA